jgi:Tetratricopeptide repeat
MFRMRNGSAAVLFALLGFCGLSNGTFAPPAYAQEAKGEALRPEVGKPLQAAQELMKAQKYKEALAKIQEAAAVANKTPYELFIIERMRGAAAAGAGDADTAGKALEAVIASGRLPPAEQLKIMEAMAGTYYRAKDYSKAAAWASRYLKEGGTDPQVRTMLAQTYYLSNDFANAAKEIQADIQADEKAGRAPTEEKLQLLASAYLKQNDNAGYFNALEKLVTYHPKKDYWADIISRIQRKPGFSDRLSLDVNRLQLATGNLTAPSDYMEMTQLALQAGFPAEAKKIIDQGFASSALGTGTDAERQKRLRDLATKQASDDRKTLAQNETEAGNAKDGTALINVGYAYVTYGDFDKGLKLMEQGLQKGSVRRPDDATLHLGEAYLLAGQKAKAVQTFKTVQGNDGTADLARLWILHAGR